MIIREIHGGNLPSIWIVVDGMINIAQAVAFGSTFMSLTILSKENVFNSIFKRTFYIATSCVFLCSSLKISQ